MELRGRTRQCKTPRSLAEEEIKTEQEVVEGMDISTRSKGVLICRGIVPALSLQSEVTGTYLSGLTPSTSFSFVYLGTFCALDWLPLVPEDDHNPEQRFEAPPYLSLPGSDPGSTERTAQKRKFPSPPHSSNGHSPQDTSTSPIKKKKKPGLLNNNNKEQKITVAECIETQSKAMTMLTIEQLSYLLKFAIQKMKQPGTDAFQKPVPLEQHPDYAEYIFHPMDLCTLEKNAKKKMYGCTEAFLADAKWILHNCIIYNGGNHKLTQIAKVVIKICEHESNPHPLVWAKLKGFPFWPAKALRDKDGQVDARFFGQHDRAWVPINNCYLMSKEIPFSVKKTKSIFNSAMQEMEVYVENIRRKFGVFNYSPFRTPYTPNSQYQMLLDPANPSAGAAKIDKQEKVKLNFDMTASPKILMSKPMLSGGTSRRVSLSDMPRSPMSTNSSVHTGSDVEQDAEKKATSSHFSASEESMDFLDKSTDLLGRIDAFANICLRDPDLSHKYVQGHRPGCRVQVPGERGAVAGDRSKAEMDLKELSESVQQQSAPVPLISPKRQIRSRFQLNLDKTIESCKAQLGINEISEDVYTAVERSDSEDSEKSDSSDSEYMSDDEQKSKNEPEDAEDKEGAQMDKEPSTVKKKPKLANPVETKEELKVSTSPTSEKADPGSVKEKTSPQPEKDFAEKAKPSPHPTKDKLKGKDETDSPTVHLGLDSDSESELVIDLGEDHSGREGRKNKKEPKEPSPKQDGKAPPSTTAGSQSPPETPVLTRSSSQTPTAGVTATTSTTSTVTAPAAAATGSPVKKQRPLLPKETAPAVQRVVWNSSTVQQKEITQSPSTSTITLVTSTQSSPLVTSSGSTSTLASSISADLPIATASADVAADIAKYTSKIRRLRIEIEKLQWLHQQELSEMKHNLELTMAEMRQSLEQERDRLIAEVKKQLELEKQQAVDETKKKQWCANCKKEAIFYCCWNTSYCDYPCQQAHWPEHMKSCTQSATAPQQEADPEVNTETLNKASQGTPSSTQATPVETSTSKEKETSAEKGKDSGSTLDLSGSRETPSSILLGSNQGSVSNRCDKQPASAPTTTDHQPHPNYPAQKYHSRSSKSSCWSGSDEKRGSTRSEHNTSASSKSLIPKESRLDTFWD
ncbi:zinc finger, MYND-type containing 8 [Camelus ferus]|nr:zinc finger, MYND-type containing 8 [Camelus ferus]